MTIPSKILDEGEDVAIPIFESQVPDQIIREFRRESLDVDQLADVLRRLLAEDPGETAAPSSPRADLRLVPARGTHVVGPLK